MSISEKFILSWADYTIIGLMLAVSALIGLCFRIFGGKQKTNTEYLLAGRDMSILPVSFSLMASFMSAPNIMGIPAEMYLFGTNMAFMNIGLILGPIISSFVFLPVYFKTGVCTSYQYLERRFGKTTRGILTVLFIIQNLLFNAVSLYAPALALSTVADLSFWTSTISIGAVCTFYCTIGGMKAVLWTDVLQGILMYLCLLAIIVKGCIYLGSLQNIFESAYDGGRILLPTFEMNYSIRYTMWSIFLQGLIIATASYGTSQMQVQRLLTVKNLKRSTIAVLISIPMLVIFQLLCCLCGLIFYAYFKNCDPLSSPVHPIKSADQLMPYYISIVMGENTGLPGLCIAGIFSATLSTVSSSVNSMAAVTSEDLIHPLWPKLSGSVLVTKIASVFYGIMSIILIFLVASLGNLVKASLMVIGMASGPALGVFILAALTTTANEMGANLGVLAGFVVGGCLSFIPNARRYPFLPMESNCSWPLKHTLNITTPVDITSINGTDPLIVLSGMETIPEDNFPVSFMWITPISLSVCLIVGYFGSLILSYFQGTSKTLPPELLSPVVRCFEKNYYLKPNEDESPKEKRFKKKSSSPELNTDEQGVTQLKIPLRS